MLFSREQSVEDRIVGLTVGERLTLTTIHKELGGGEKLTLRAVYKAVDKLIKAGVLIKVGKRVTVDGQWASGVGDRLAKVAGPTLGAGERASYTFTSIDSLDAFWVTTVMPLEAASSKGETFFYNPHNFWAYLPSRKESEDAYYEHFATSKQQGFFTVGGDTAADLEFKRGYQTDKLQITLINISDITRRDHITVIEPFVVTVRLTRSLAEKIDYLYAFHPSIQTLTPQLVKLCEKPGKIKLLVENDAAKAKKLRKILAKDFYFKKS